MSEKNNQETKTEEPASRSVRMLKPKRGPAMRITTQPISSSEAQAEKELEKLPSDALATRPTEQPGKPEDSSPDKADEGKKTQAKKAQGTPRQIFHQHLPIGEKILFFKHLSVMPEAGIPLQEALEVLAEQTMSKNLKSILDLTLKDIGNGYELSWSFAKFPRAFDSFLTNVIGVGEESGTLPAQLKYLSVQLEKRKILDNNVRSAFFYPVIVFVGALAIGSYLAFFLLPKLIPLFLSLKVALPPTTRLLIWISRSGAKYWKVGSLIMLALAALGAVLVRNKTVKYYLHGMFISLPVFGSLVRDLQLVQFSRVLGTLLASGSHIVSALKITASSMTNVVYTNKLEIIMNAVERGQSLTSALKEHPKLFSRTVVSMVGVGEKTGRLPVSLLSYAEFAEHELDNMTKNLSTLIEPILLMVVGLIVGFVALSIITPIYQLTQSMSR